MKTTGWGIIGPGAIAQNFADGLAEALSGRLVAIASRDDNRRTAFGSRNGVDPAHRHKSYADLVADPAVDAVYISTPHPFHAEHALLALRAGKPVLVEKPAGLTAAQVSALTELAAQSGLLFAEAYMYRCHPQIARLLDILQSGEIGTLRHIRTQFGFAAGSTRPRGSMTAPLVAAASWMSAAIRCHWRGWWRGQRWARFLPIRLA